MGSFSFLLLAASFLSYLYISVSHYAVVSLLLLGIIIIAAKTTTAKNGEGANEAQSAEGTGDATTAETPTNESTLSDAPTEVPLEVEYVTQKRLHTMPLKITRSHADIAHLTPAQIKESIAMYFSYFPPILFISLLSMLLLP